MLLRDWPRCAQCFLEVLPEEKIVLVHFFTPNQLKLPILRNYYGFRSPMSAS
jgi:hypothetical protein